MRPESHERLGIYLRYAKIISEKLLHESQEEMSSSLDIPRIFRYVSVVCIPQCLFQCLSQSKFSLLNTISAMALTLLPQIHGRLIFPAISLKLANNF